MDSIYIGDLLPATRRAIDAFLCALELDARAERTWWDFDELCGLFFRLKYTEDNPEVFPHGKWATLQAIEQRLEAAIQLDLDLRK